MGTVSHQGTAVSVSLPPRHQMTAVPKRQGTLLLSGNLVLQILPKPSTHLTGIVVAVGGYRMLRGSNHHFVFLT